MFSAQNKMSMDKEKYKERLHALVEELKACEDNELIDYLLAQLSSTTLGIEKIDQIYEYCIEKNARKQAKYFYSSFPLNEIIPDLVEDFIRMEMFRRHDNFIDFCMALYQQIERITNKLCTDKTLDEIVSKMWSCNAYIKSGIDKDGNKIDEKIGNRITGEYNIAKLVLIDSPREPYSQKCLKQLQNQYALDKIRIIIYYLGYSALLRSGDFEYFKDICQTMSDIYMCRNLNHRGTNHTEWEQSVYDRIEPNRYFYYLHFQGALAQYVRFIIEGYKKLPDILVYARTVIPKTIIKGPKIVGAIDLDLLKK